jgi:esterase/lipase superfamily enzyme/sugar lactone lactonase YvrE
MRYATTLMFGFATNLLMAISGDRACAQTMDPNTAPNPYRMAETWAQLPEDRKWGSAFGVGVDKSDGRSLWVFDRCASTDCSNSMVPPIQKFDPTGKYVRGFGANMFNTPHGLFVDHEGNVWVTDETAKNGKGAVVVKFSPEGRVLMTLGKLGTPGDNKDTLNGPSGVTVAPNGDIYIADGHGGNSNDRIVKFSKDGKFITSWGKHGKEPGEFDTPHGIALDSAGRVFVADRGNNRIQIFNSDGKYVAEWKQFGRPNDLTIDKNDTIYVTDSQSTPTNNPGIRQGIRIGSAKDGKVTAFIPETLTGAPDGIAADDQGNLYGSWLGKMTVARFAKQPETARPAAPPAPYIELASLNVQASPPNVSEPDRKIVSDLAEDKQLISILFATNRELDPQAGPRIDPHGVGYARSKELTLGSALVRVPEAHKIGRIERPWNIVFLGISISTSEDEKSHFVIKQAGTMSREDFTGAIRQSGKDSAFIFVHGFDTSFADALFDVAQIVHDTNISSMPIAFSWPSKATMFGYDYDRESASRSRDLFAQLVELLQREAAISNIYIAAHSLGNQIVADFLDYAQIAKASFPLSEIAFAAPDVDRDHFAELVGKLKQTTPRLGLTLYASSADRALNASGAKAQGARAGDIPKAGLPLTIPGMETIDVSALGQDMWSLCGILGHCPFSNRSIIDDIGRLVVGKIRPPHIRSPQLQRVPAGSDPPLYWQYPR